MATRGLTQRDSTMQLRTLNSRPGQKDNSEWLRKVKIQTILCATDVHMLHYCISSF